MKVNSLAFSGYRNLKQGTLLPSGQVNIIYGSNAQGKTNLLEALWLFTGGKSFRGSKDTELVGFHTDKAALALSFCAQGREQSAEIRLEEGKRKVFLNEIPLKSSSALVGNFCSVIFSPVHLSLIKDGPGERRKFLDAALCQMKPSYAAALGRYNRGVLQRNALLKELYRRPYLEETLDVWDEKLAQLGSIVIMERLRYIRRLEPEAEKVYEGFSRGKETLAMQYLSNIFNGKEKIENLQEIQSFLLMQFGITRKEDIRLGYTTIGPHRDDLELLIDGHSARSFGSQGQQRSAVLSLKLSEAMVLKETIGEEPVVLLDDVMSELDAERQDYILNHMEGWQVFVTCCEPGTMQRMTQGRLFFMADGNVVPAPGTTKTIKA